MVISRWAHHSSDREVLFGQNCAGRRTSDQLQGADPDDLHLLSELKETNIHWSAAKAHGFVLRHDVGHFGGRDLTLALARIAGRSGPQP